MERFYSKLEEKVKTQVRDCLINLTEQPYLGKRLHGDLKENYSLPTQKLRIIYAISEKEKTIYIIAIGHRRTIYQE